MCRLKNESTERKTKDDSLHCGKVSFACVCPQNLIFPAGGGHVVGGGATFGVKLGKDKHLVKDSWPGCFAVVSSLLYPFPCLALSKSSMVFRRAWLGPFPRLVLSLSRGISSSSYENMKYLNPSS